MSAILVLLFAEPKKSKAFVIIIFVEWIQMLRIVVYGYVTSVPLVPTHCELVFMPAVSESD